MHSSFIFIHYFINFLRFIFFVIFEGIYWAAAICAFHSHHPSLC